MAAASTLHMLRNRAAKPGLPAAAALGTLTAAALGAGVFYKIMSSHSLAEAETPPAAASRVGQQQQAPPPKIFGSGPAFASLKLESSTDVNHNTKLLRFAFPREDALSGLKLTSAVLTFSWPEGCWLPVLRPYTPISKLDEPGHLSLLVKHYPGGKSSTHLHSLKPGECLRFITAIPSFAWPLVSSSSSAPAAAKPTAPTNITLIAGGAGITPMFQLIQGILDGQQPSRSEGGGTTSSSSSSSSSVPSMPRKITLFFGVNTPADVLLKKEFDEYEAKFRGTFKVVYTVSKDSGGGAGAFYKNGYVTKELLEKEIGTKREEGEKVFVCGPPAMEAALVGKQKKDGGVLGELGFEKGQVYRF